MTADTVPGTSTLWDSLLRGSTRGSLYHWSEGRYEQLPWSRVVSDAHGMAARLRAAGVGPGTRAAAVLTNSADTVSGLLAVWLAGGAVASLPLPSRGQTAQEYGGLLSVLLDRLDPTVLLLDESVLPKAVPEIGAKLPVLSWSELHSSGSVEPSPPGDEDVAFIQYSSGSTSLPKGCELTPRAIAAQLGMLREMTEGRPGAETLASWLPLSHDMGVFGSLLYAWAHDYRYVLSTPERFGMAPRSWFRDMAEFGATMTGGTSTALRLSARAQGRHPLPRRLELRVCVVGAERVDWSAITDATAAFADSGLPTTAFMPAYGMAEATLAVSATPVTARPSVRSFDSPSLAAGKVCEVEESHPRAVRHVSNGTPLPGVSVTAGRRGEIGELRVSSPSLAAGYHRDPVRTEERFHGGVLHTGDLGFLLDGEVYVAGRSDDLLSVGGRSVHSGDIEAAIDGLGAARSGCLALVDVADDGPARLVLLLEPRYRKDDFRAIADTAATVALEKAGVALSECVFLERGGLPRTPSGKIQRFRCRTMLSGGGRIDALARVRLG